MCSSSSCTERDPQILVYPSNLECFTLARSFLMARSRTSKPELNLRRHGRPHCVSKLNSGRTVAALLWPTASGSDAADKPFVWAVSNDFMDKGEALGDLRSGSAAGWRSYFPSHVGNPLVPSSPRLVGLTGDKHQVQMELAWRTRLSLLPPPRSPSVSRCPLRRSARHQRHESRRSTPSQCSDSTQVM